jgi:prepilin-type N-terminal cleavage/methylation domain-containing protein
MTQIAAGERGFTLVEVMIALLLLLIGMSGVALAQIQALRSSANSAQKSKALYLAEETMETFHALSFASPLLTSTSVVRENNGNPIDVDGDDDDFTAYYRCWQVQPNTPVAGVSTITVEVRVGDPNCNPADPSPPPGAYARITGVKG